jgi:hypothetical protein
MSSCSLPSRRDDQEIARGTPNSIHVPLFKEERLRDEAAPEVFSNWPQVVQNLHTRELNRWAERNPDLDIIEQTHSFDAGRRVTVTEWHFAERPRAGATDGSAP